MAEKVNFDDIFGDRANLDRKEDELNKLATPDNLKQLRIDISDFVESKQNMNRLRKDAYDFQTNYRNLLSNYKDCVDDLKNMNGDADDNIRDRDVGTEKYQNLLKARDQLEQDLKDLQNKIRADGEEFSRAYDHNQKEINKI
jgi:gas vesicle protein